LAALMGEEGWVAGMLLICVTLRCNVRMVESLDNRL
jgi:hypothetical protein